MRLAIHIPVDWSSLEDVTDATVLAAACERNGVPMPDEQVQGRIAERIGALLTTVLTDTPDRFRPIAGATGVFAALRVAGWSVAMATGAWRPSALVKLRGAGIPHDDVPLASASDHAARADIIRHAVRAVGGAPSAVVYVGDGLWDGRAARALGYPFMGVGQGARADELRGAGAGAVIPDFADARSVLEHLARLVA